MNATKINNRRVAMTFSIIFLGIMNEKITIEEIAPGMENNYG